MNDLPLPTENLVRKTFFSVYKHIKFFKDFFVMLHAVAEKVSSYAEAI